MMTNEEYFKNIYCIKNEIDQLEENFFSQDRTDEEAVAFENARAVLVKELEAAYTAE